MASPYYYDNANTTDKSYQTAPAKPAAEAGVHQLAYNTHESTTRVRAAAENLRDELLQRGVPPEGSVPPSPNTIDSLVRGANCNAEATLHAISEIRAYLLG